MSVEIGPLGEQDESPSIIERAGCISLWPVYLYLNEAIEDHLALDYDWRSNVLRLHGTSEDPRDGFSRGLLLSAGPILLNFIGAFWVVASVATPIPVLFGVLAVLTMIGSMKAWQHAKVIDHTTEKVVTERVEELQEEFADGEISEDEFDELLEQELEKH